MLVDDGTLCIAEQAIRSICEFRRKELSLFMVPVKLNQRYLSIATIAAIERLGRAQIPL